jgi:glycosyltransferase involved in cell wall biosynthesis
MAEYNPRLRVFRLSRRFGKEAAICAGLTQVRGQAAVLMDSDLQHPPALIREMYRLWKEEGYDVVEAVKECRGDEPLRSHLGAPLFYKLFRMLSGIQLEGATDFKLMDRKAIDAWAALPERAVFFRGMSAWIGFHRKQLHFTVPKRSAGTSQWSSIQLMTLALDSITSFSTLPIHVITCMGVAFLVFAVALSGLALYYKLTGLSVSGFTTVIILQSMIGSMLMIGIGIIGQYISKIYEEAKGRPRFIVAESANAEPGNTDMAPPW